MTLDEISPSEITKKIDAFDLELSELDSNLSGIVEPDLSDLLDDWEALAKSMKKFMEYHEQEMTKYADKVAELEADP